MVYMGCADACTVANSSPGRSFRPILQLNHCRRACYGFPRSKVAHMWIHIGRVSLILSTSDPQQRVDLLSAFLRPSSMLLSFIHAAPFLYLYCPTAPFTSCWKMHFAPPQLPTGFGASSKIGKSYHMLCECTVLLIILLEAVQIRKGNEQQTFVSVCQPTSNQARKPGKEAFDTATTQLHLSFRTPQREVLPPILQLGVPQRDKDIKHLPAQGVRSTYRCKNRGWRSHSAARQAGRQARSEKPRTNYSRAIVRTSYIARDVEPRPSQSRVQLRCDTISCDLPLLSTARLAVSASPLPVDNDELHRLFSPGPELLSVFQSFPCLCLFSWAVDVDTDMGQTDLTT
jgi:hypothetical protein